MHATQIVLLKITYLMAIEKGKIKRNSPYVIVLNLIILLRVK